MIDQHTLTTDESVPPIGLAAFKKEIFSRSLSGNLEILSIVDRFESIVSGIFQQLWRIES